MVMALRAAIQLDKEDNMCLAGLLGMELEKEIQPVTTLVETAPESWQEEQDDYPVVRQMDQTESE
jgi:hypothetical protein